MARTANGTKKKPAQPPQRIWTVTDPKEIERRLAMFRCLGCNEPGMNLPANIDPETGFTSQYCVNCREHNRNARPKQIPGAAKFRREHKAEGLDNLDRLMGLK